MSKENKKNTDESTVEHSDIIRRQKIWNILASHDLICLESELHEIEKELKELYVNDPI